MAEKKEKVSIWSHAKTAALLLVALIMVVYLLTVIGESGRFFDGAAERSALLLLEDELDLAEPLVEEHYNNLYEIADGIKYADNRSDVENVLATYIGSDKFGDLRYYAQGKSYAANGIEVSEETSAHDMITALAASNVEGCTEVYYDSHTTQYCMAFFVPVRGSVFVDGVLSIVPARNIINMTRVMTDGAVSVALVAPDGKIFAAAKTEKFETTLGNDYYQFISKLTNDKNFREDLGVAIASGEKTSMTIGTQSANYVFSISPISSFSNNLYLISMRESTGLVAPELTYIRHVINLLAAALIIVTLVTLYIIIFRRRAKRAVAVAVLTDPILECSNVEGFQSEAREILAYGNKCVLMAITIRNFSYNADILGEDGTKSILRYLVKTLDTYKGDGECYGYAGDGKFLFLKRYSNEKILAEWIRLISSLINKNDDVKAGGIKILFDVGVFKIFEGRKRTISEMIECANAAAMGAASNIEAPFVFYSEEINRQRAKRDRIESQMESALEHGEFRVFLQPKYNVKHDRIDSAEALVRWFDPEKGDYMFPGEFISQFESNGFITKLDHFVYVKVLEYLSEAAERGEKIVPISVNVSRVTAGREDFLSFYIGNKQKYKVGDGFIILELTESFAMEDYEKILSIVENLRENGIKSSIDDFGSGYSSFNIIRQVSADELKLDRAFLQKSGHGSTERDDKILETVIDLAKSLGMIVVQEGVETKEDFDRVVAKGCDVIQGYYYAKAIPMEEYRIFIRTNTSIKYKSLVK